MAANQMQRALQQPARNTTRRIQVFAEVFSGTASRPYMVSMDSGAVYRVFASVDTAALIITPRLSTLPPVRFSSMVSQGSAGMRFVAPATTTYGVESSYTGRVDMLVRIYKEEAVDCAAEAGAPGCGQVEAPERRGFHPSPAVMIMVGFLPLLFMGMMRNGKSF